MPVNKYFVFFIPDIVARITLLQALIIQSIFTMSNNNNNANSGTSNNSPYSSTPQVPNGGRSRGGRPQWRPFQRPEDVSGIPIVHQSWDTFIANPPSGGTDPNNASSRGASSSMSSDEHPLPNAAPGSAQPRFMASQYAADLPDV